MSSMDEVESSEKRTLHLCVKYRLYFSMQSSASFMGDFWKSLMKTYIRGMVMDDVVDVFAILFGWMLDDVR